MSCGGIRIGKCVVSSCMVNGVCVCVSPVWNVFRNRGFHFIYLNTNSLLSKIEELAYILQNLLMMLLQTVNLNLKIQC